jgi:hypothetical protein
MTDVSFEERDAAHWKAAAAINQAPGITDDARRVGSMLIAESALERPEPCDVWLAVALDISEPAVLQAKAELRAVGLLFEARS